MSAIHFPTKLRLEIVVLICGAILGLLLFYDFFFSPAFETHWRLIQRLP
jgi:hypothetical protein